MRWLGPVLLLASAAVAFAQEPGPQPKQQPEQSEQPAVVERQVKGRAGRTIRLLTITNVRADCTSGPLPTVRLATAPKHGRVAVQRGKYTATNRRQCLAVEAPALVALYRPAAGFDGTDVVTLEIRFDGKPPQLRRYTISVTKVDDGSQI